MGIGENACKGEIEMKRMIAAAAVLLAVTVVGCAAPTAVDVTEQDDGAAITVSRGGVLTIALSGNPTTGYTWSAYDPPAIVEQRGEVAFEPDSDALGSGGVMTLEFEAVEVGTGSLELWYSRPWESTQPERTFTLEVTVE